MPYWVFRSRTDVCLREGDDWLQLLPGVLGDLQVDALQRILVDARPDGVVRVADAGGTVRVLARALPPGAVPTELAEAIGSVADLGVDHVAPAHLAFEDAQMAALEDSEILPPVLPDNVAEGVFERTRAIVQAATVEEAAAATLRVVQESVDHAHAASVLRADLDDQGFRFIAAVGPKADAVRGRTLPFGSGLVGHVHDTGVGVLVADTTHSARHLHHIADAVGYRPRAVLALPLVSGDGRSFGVLEVLSVDAPFAPWHAVLVEEIALVLADRMAAG
jgi:hypothetical protein